MVDMLTYPTAIILQAIDSGFTYGFDIVEATGLATGTVYPALRRLEGLGYLRAKWESERAATNEGRPPRRHYQVTRDGRAALEEARQRFPGLVRVLA
ncbi:MAG TPA: PadR family transcriptional regulator [Thermoanaerobaculia bacterium]|nr:PadR family transcriptional regulator [Thermoanaerobaculia bacterium]